MQNQLNQMQNQRNQLNNQVTNINTTINNLNRRRNDVLQIQTNLNNTSNTGVSNVNSRMNSANNALTSGLSSSTLGGRIQGIFSGKNERAIGSDSDLTDTNASLQREIGNIDNQLQTQRTALSNATNSVNNLNSNISAQERAIRTEQNKR
jgi:uncharacterized coiled-coil DUF342 family protein